MCPVKKVRIIDIAKSAGVSIGTVDRVIHNRGEVAKETREKVQKVIEELNYKPDILARTLVMKKKWRFAALIPGSFNQVSFWDDPLKGMYRALSEISHFGVTLEEYLFSVFDLTTFEQKSAELLRNKPDGVVVAPLYARHAISFLRKCRDLSIPVVLINAFVPLRYPLAFIGQNSRQSGRVAAHLFERMLPRDALIAIVSIAGPIEEQVHISEREKGFSDYFSQNSSAKVNTTKILHVRSNEAQAIQKSLRDFLEVNPSISGIFVVNSNAGKVAEALQSLNHSVSLLAGYDLTPENRTHLEKGNITFLIGQKPDLQGYLGLMDLYNALVMQKPVDRISYMPIDIITRENLMYYE
ncbi:MAG TPA: LacI family DNA-binding transcriptional regulator [Bacteroidales bacterium]|nr:LacI family DNA-binding transcriptional regulator [Bacteroidales bacterium]HQK37510.1 LacI family DNA-binding transcriptional regulator [Bacteroidales bacterium]